MSEKWYNEIIEYTGKNAWVQTNPLTWFEADDYQNKTGQKPPMEDLFTYLSNGIVDGGIDYCIQQYAKIRLDALILLPGNSFFIEKIASPLKYAICNYMLRNSLGTVVLCGIIGEMMINLTFEVWNEEESKKRMDESEQQKTFGRKFEDLNQKKKISGLFRKEIISEKSRDYLERIREIRNEYVHFYSKDPKDIDKDALEIFKFTNKMIEEILHLEFKNKKGWMNTHFVNYVKKRT